MPKYFISFAFLICILNIHAQSVIIIQRGATTFLQTRLDSAIAHSQSGDFIYLPGGLIGGASGTIIVNKKLSIIGAGYHPDSSVATGTTQIAGDFRFNSPAEGSLLTGVFATGGVSINCSNITLLRCNIASINLAALALSNIIIEESICRGTLTGSSLSLSSISFKKNIIYGNGTSLGSGGITFSNNIFHGTIGNGQSLPGDCIFQNNVFTSTSITTNTAGVNCQYLNNLFVLTNSAAISTNNTNTSNIFGEPLANIFINYTSGSPWSKTQNFRLKAGCQGIGLGTDGTDVGVYGSSTPFKEGALPFNPHFKAISIPNTTSADGKLNINITAEAQQF